MTTTPQTRECRAIRCRLQIKTTMFMCPHHWNLLPATIRSTIWSTLRAWRTGGSEWPYILACKTAQLFIAQAEGLPEYVSSLTESVGRIEQRLEDRKRRAIHG